LPHQPRRRRDCLSELLQIDGSKHVWFEDRRPANAPRPEALIEFEKRPGDLAPLLAVKDFRPASFVGHLDLMDDEKLALAAHSRRESSPYRRSLTRSSQVPSP
jgi:hypothetical protein